jgi:Na+/H+ antiporter NhaC
LKRIYFLLYFITVVFAVSGQDTLIENPDIIVDLSKAEISIEPDDVIVQHIPFDINIKIEEFIIPEDQIITIQILDSVYQLPFGNGEFKFESVVSETTEFTISVDDNSFNRRLTPIPLWMSILPPLIAILIALIFREVFSALFIGLLAGSAIITYYKGFSILSAVFYGLLHIVDIYILESLNDSGHLSIIVFSMLIGAMVHLIAANGGMKGVVNVLSRYANNPKSGQFITWLLGIAIFFDDYANTLVIGNTMRPVTDRLNISREKLSYIVDSTAAPIAAIAFVTTWIGAELSYIEDGIGVIGLNETAYGIFLNSLAFSFYPVLALLFIPILICSGRDFGPMLKAEKMARKSGVQSNIAITKDFDIDSIDSSKERGFNAIIPVLVIVFGTILALISTGLQAVGWSEELSFSSNLSNVIGNADSYKALLWSSLSGTIVAVLLTVSQRLMSLKESIEQLIKGFKTMLTAVLILVLAWSIALITEYMHTADFISGILLDINIAPFLLPAFTFILAALIAFSTGSSWGTMAILYPLILPATWLIAMENGLDYDASLAIFVNVVSTVLSGSVFGDHCSPISDTTILSSLASSCNHIDHVRTQLPYALTVGMVATFFGTIPAAYGVPSYILFPIGLLILFILVRWFGKKVSTV